MDESILAYQPRKETKMKANVEQCPIPVVYIPRKPHKNGFLIYQAVTYVTHPLKPTSKLPFIVDMFPHFTPGDITPISSIEKMINK